MDFEAKFDGTFEDHTKIRRKSKRRQEVSDIWLEDAYESDFADDYKPRKNRKANWDPEQQARKSKKRKNRRPRQDEFDY